LFRRGSRKVEKEEGLSILEEAFEAVYHSGHAISEVK
jgi:hypothetical protein